MYCAPGRNLIGRGVSASPAPTPTPTPTPGTSPVGLPSPESWLDISQEMGVDGVGLTALSDRIVAGRTFSSSVTNPGTYRTNQRNGLPILRTASTTSAYLASAAPLIGSSTPFCLWFVGQSDGSDAIIWGNQAPNHQVRLNYSGDRSMFLFNGPAVASNPLTLAESTAWNVYFFVRNSANETRFYLNGVPKFSAASNSITGSLNLGRFLETFGSRFVGDFGEAGYNTADLTTVQLNSLGQYLGNKWAIAWTPIA
jgi:hypothetical protein